LRSITETLRLLADRGIELELDGAGEGLVVRGRRQALDADLVARLREEKAELVAHLRAEQTEASAATPVGGFLADEQSRLVALTAAEIAAVVATVPGGEDNLQDVYPLAPLQEGVLFHHLAAPEGDPYLLSVTYAFDTRERLDAYLSAYQAVIDRHDILRTAVLWEDVPEPVQVVWRSAPLPVEEVDLGTERTDGGDGGDAAEQLRARCDPRRIRLDVRRAPLLRVCVARDPAGSGWLMVMLMHHLVGDHATLQVIHQEVGALMRGEPLDGVRPRPFRDFVAEVRGGLGRAEHEAFFSAMLGDVEEPTAPYDVVEAPGEGHATVEEARALLDTGVSARLREAGRRLGVSTASLCHLAWAQVLARLTGREDVVFGTVLFGRLHGAEGVGSAVGPFINTLPLRLAVDGSRPVREAVQDTQVALAELLRHEHASLVLAQRCSGVPAPAPLFTSILNYRHSAGEPSGSEPVWPGVEQVAGQERTSYPLTVSVDDIGDGLALTVQAVAPLDPKRVGGYLRAALTGLADALEREPERPLADIDVLPLAEREQLLALGGARTAGAEAGAGTGVCLTDLFEAQAARTPEAVAVCCGAEPLSYARLDERANRLARRLRALGAGPDRLVALCAQRGVDLVVGLLGILKAGSGYLPLDASHPAARRAAMIADSGAVALVTDDGADLDGAGPEVVRLDDPDTWAYPGERLTRAETGLRPEHLAYVIYTSGSTGVPKGVQVEHAQVVRLFSACAGRFGFGPEDVWTLFHSVAFDFSVWEIWGALLHGGRLVVVPQAVARAPEDFHRLLCDEAVTVLSHTPGAFRQLLAARAAAPRPHRLRHVVFGGEALDTAVLEPWFADPGNAGTRLTNMYGITETTVHVTHRTLTAADVARRGPAPIGVPLADLRAYLLDRHGRLVPPGVTGELHVGGAGVARGYLNRPELTGERFLSDPFAGGTAPQRMYRTGDLARWNADGELDYLGRADAQVKIRGFRVELGEIEARLGAHPGVRDRAVVLAAPDAAGERRLVAYVVPTDPGAAPGAEELRGHLSVDLPAHMVPAAFVALDALPLTRNGKLDRAALPAPDGSAYRRHGYQPPLGATETALAEIWTELLQVERVSRTDDFFDLGGHSLLVVALLERMRRRGLHTDVRAVFAEPTLSGLASRVGGESGMVEVPPNLIPDGCTRITPDMLPLVELTQPEVDLIAASVAGGAANIQDIYPLAPLQEGILFHHLMQQDQDPFLLYSLLEMRTRDHADRFTAALQAVVDRHDLLRTGFLWEGLPAPVQVVWRRAPIYVEQVRLDPADGDLADQLRERYSPSTSWIDVRVAPLTRIYLCRDDAADRWLLMVIAHHLTDDYTTYRLMLSEIATHILGRQDELPAPLPFRNFIAQSRNGISVEEHEAFFRTMLGDVTEPTAPFGLLEVRGHGGGTRAANQLLDPALSARLRVRARALGVSPASLFHLAWAQVLGRITGREDVVFGTVLFGRMAGGEGADRVMGVFINTLPIRIALGADGVADGARRVYQGLTELLRHEHAPLALAQRCSAVPQPMPLFSALLNYRYSVQLASMRKPEDAPANDGIQMVYASERSNYPLMLAVDDVGDDFELTAHVEAPHSPERVCAFVQHALRTLVAALDGEPQRPLRELDVLPPEQAGTLADWSAPVADFPHGACVHDLFEQQVRRSPEAVALASGPDVVGYAELNGRANRLARRLRRAGVGADDRVAVSAERGIAQVTALLAVLKAGAAYVPLDPGYPAARLSRMLRDSAPAVVLTAGQRPGAAVRAALAGGGVAPLVCDLDTSADWAGESPEDLGIGARPEQLAYVIYTSGSTGVPKGVAGEHRALVNRLHWTGAGPLASGAGQVHAQKTSIGFVDALTETLTPLVSGATLRVVPAEAAVDPSRLAEFLRGHAVTRLTLVPSLLRALLELPAATLPPLVVCSGEALPSVLAARVREACPGTTLVNLYGSSEVAGDVTAQVVDTVPEDADALVPIGRPIPNAVVRILDGRGRPAPIGAPGEIHVGGVAPARGYLGAPELTAERFLEDPGTADGPAPARLFRTGDLGRWREDGGIDYLGRRDGQIKLRGFRVELGEVEARLRALPAVRDAAVVVQDDEAGDRRLVGCLVPAAGSAPSAEELRAGLAAELPDHMVPAAFVALPELPLTPSGKLDRAALAATLAGEATAATAIAATAREHVEPVGAVERAIAEVWATVLRADRVGRDDRFLDLGGHSLLAVKVASRLGRAGVQVSVPELFANPSVQRLAQLAAARNPRVSERDPVRLRAGAGATPLFLVHDGAASLLYAFTLADFVDPQVPVYGLPPVPLGDPGLTTVEGMAARMVRMIRAVQPQGPYRVAGWCTGGAIAYEIAVQLLGEDQEVEFVGLLNTTYYPPEQTPPNRCPDDRAAFLGSLAAPAELLDAWAAQAGSSTLGQLVDLVTAEGLLPAPLAGLDAEEIGLALRRRFLVAEAGLRYVPPPLPIPVYYFSAVEHDPGHPYGRWDDAVPEVEWRRVPVQRTHQSMMQLPDVRELGARLSEAVTESAKDIGRRDRPRTEALHRLQVGRRTRVPLICVPGAGANVAGFHALVSSLDPTLPVHGLQPRGVDGLDLPHTGVEAAATAHLAEVLPAVGDGPVHLVGHSFGGWVAFDLACRLRERGVHVASLTLVDSDAPASGPGPVEADETEVLLTMAALFENLTGRPMGLTRDLLEPLPAADRRATLHARLVEAGGLPQRTTPDLLTGPIRTFARCVRTSYTPRSTYPGPVTLVTVDDPTLDPQAGAAHRAHLERAWRRSAPQLEVWHGPGNHMTVLNPPHVTALAGFLTRRHLNPEGAR
jgi:amino acid adenylation domain-containing protein